MNVLFVSQCSGRALTESRRILDQFGERTGERSWQTPITQKGLETVHRLLRASARKNTAVACFWLHRNGSELVWIVGDRSRFDERGRTPTNRTQADLLRRQDEDDWRHGEVIRILAGLAALFHDLGKASQSFQDKLRGNARTQDAFRHEWGSLRLFTTLVGGDDRAWLEHLADPEAPLPDPGRALVRDGLVDRAPAPLKGLPPLARAVAWLIVGHHRLPRGEVRRSGLLKTLETTIKVDWGYTGPPDPKAVAACWAFPQALPWTSKAWRKRAARLARAALRHPDLLGTDWLDRPFVAHLARLSLMLADHDYSSGPSHPELGDPEFPSFANTDPQGRCKQRLDEHLVGVQRTSSALSWALPRLEWQLPRIARHRGFRRRTKASPFKWQNRAFDLAEALRTRSARQGFFGVNMASTGTGKTLANGRILYGLADPQRGARFTIALGLRVLTLQTGDAYRERLGLDAADLAVQVGGSAVQELHGLSRSPGSDSAAGLLAEDSHVHYEGSLEEGPLKRWLGRQPRALAEAPILACTIDHLVPATEATRGGRQILPMLRLLSADLVLDEVDDYDLADLPAVTRLVHWAGMLGSRVLLSSATLPPALVQGLFQAYLQGRRAFQDSRGEPEAPLAPCCAWFDEFGATASEHGDPEGFLRSHQAFVDKRIERLRQTPQRRHARIHPLGLAAEGAAEGDSSEARRDQLCAGLARHLHQQIAELHRANAEADPRTGKRVSIGLIRMANIDPLVHTARRFIAIPPAPGQRLHLAVYHAHFPLFRRAHLEARLDRILRRQGGATPFDHPEIRQALDRHPEPDQVFVVLASPVAEVGRDHDYDWAIVEPSSLRSLIQLAGRIRRHRLEPHGATNLLLLSTNLKALEGREIAYAHPGYESQGFRLASHDLRDLLRPEEVARIDAEARIRPAEPLQPRDRLADLEHAVLADLMLGDGGERLPVTWWWETHVHLADILQRLQPFRAGRSTETYLLLPDDLEGLGLHRRERDGSLAPVEYLREALEVDTAPGCQWWGEAEDLVLLEDLAQRLGLEIDTCARRFGLVELPEEEAWLYHPLLGFFRER